MTVRPDDILHAVGHGDKWSIVDLAKDTYGSSDAADPLMAYNGFSFPKAEPMPGGTTVTLPYTLSGAISDPKNGIFEIAVFTQQPRILDLQWQTKEIVANDGSNDPSMFAEVIGKTISCSDETAATFEIYQYDAKGKHDLIDSNPSCKIINNELKGADGKPLKIWIEWHKTIYDWERPYYFGKLIIDKKEFVMPQKKETMLRLKQYHYLVNDPASNFPTKVDNKCAWLKHELQKLSKYKNPFVGKSLSDNSHVHLIDGKKGPVVTVKDYSDCISKGTVYHHFIDSHGIARCFCDGNENWVVNKKGKDGVCNYTQRQE